MDSIKVAKELITVAKLLQAVDPDLQAVANVVKSGSFMSLRGALTNLKLGKVDFHMGDGPAMWVIKTKRGKTIGIVNDKDAEPTPSEISVNGFVVGYL